MSKETKKADLGEYWNKPLNIPPKKVIRPETRTYVKGKGFEEPVKPKPSHSTMPRMTMKAEALKGGKADGKPSSKYNKRQLKIGAKHEEEHTKSKKAALEIAKDHLEEDPKYYDHLKQMEKKVRRRLKGMAVMGKRG